MAGFAKVAALAIPAAQGVRQDFGRLTSAHGPRCHPSRADACLLPRRRLGLSFKVGTDDLRESPVVIMAETLLGKGFKLSIHDSEVELTRLTGANKRFLEDKLPHINSLLAPSLKDVIARSQTLVVCKNAPEYRELAKFISSNHHVVDLVAALKGTDFSAPQYHGLYW